MWGVDAGEPHRAAVAAGDLAVIYVGPPQRAFVGRARLASAVRDWTPAEARVYPGRSQGGVLLTDVEEWDPPVLMQTVVPQSIRQVRTPTCRPMPRTASGIASFRSPITNTRQSLRLGLKLSHGQLDGDRVSIGGEASILQKKAS